MTTPENDSKESPQPDKGPPGNPYDAVFILFIFPLLLVFLLKVLWVLFM